MWSFLLGKQSPKCLYTSDTYLYPDANMHEHAGVSALCQGPSLVRGADVVSALEQADDRADMAHRLAASAATSQQPREPHYPGPAVEELLAHELRRRDSAG
jgi:hypothetical protein